MKNSRKSEYCDRVKLAARGDPVQTITTLKEDGREKEPQDRVRGDGVLRDDGVFDDGCVGVGKQRDNLRRVWEMLLMTRLQWLL